MNDSYRYEIPDEKPGMVYEITIKGQLAEHWSDWLAALSIDHDSQGHTLIRCEIPDQAALHGTLAQIRNLGLRLIAITPIHSEKGTQ